jgi:hypothetical protein
MIAYPNPKDYLALTLSTLCAAGEATHLGAAGQHNIQAARGNRGEYTKPNLSEYDLIILHTFFRRLLIPLSKESNKECCGSGMFIPDSGFFTPIPYPGSRVQKAHDPGFGSATLIPTSFSIPNLSVYDLIIKYINRTSGMCLPTKAFMK